ncbi:MAG: YfiR family protein, partial [Limisphaerales bacterium]
MPRIIFARERTGWKIQTWRTGAFFVCYLWLMVLYGLPGKADAQTVSREYPLKAVFLLNFARFTEWPSDAFESTNSPFVIGILGKNPFGSLLDDTVQNERLGRHQFVVETYQNVNDITNCDMLYISETEDGHLNDILAHLKGKTILTVSDIPNAVQRGVCVQFIT